MGHGSAEGLWPWPEAGSPFLTSTPAGLSLIPQDTICPSFPTEGSFIGHGGEVQLTQHTKSLESGGSADKALQCP